MKSSPELNLLIKLIEESYERKAWHGPNLRGSIRGLSAKEALRKPGPKRHSIWEIVIHCAYWKYVVRRRILGEKKGSFYLKGSNFFPVPDPANEAAWRQTVEMLGICHETMLEAIGDLKPSDLRKTPRGSRVPTDAILRGIGSHDVYHAGQIQLIKRLIR